MNYIEKSAWRKTTKMIFIVPCAVVSRRKLIHKKKYSKTPDMLCILWVCRNRHRQ
ncbi:unnamed protein product [Larinioides sclopetarius]|uniref:Uncharacterized protein n=1 Tax=Larinioides sclopetarius TaxID=280406 RepID=A0AAV1YZY4_9ARAC